MGGSDAGPGGRQTRCQLFTLYPRFRSWERSPRQSGGLRFARKRPQARESSRFRSKRRGRVAPSRRWRWRKRFALTFGVRKTRLRDGSSGRKKSLQGVAPPFDSFMPTKSMERMFRFLDWGHTATLRILWLRQESTSALRWLIRKSLGHGVSFATGASAHCGRRAGG